MSLLDEIRAAAAKQKQEDAPRREDREALLEEAFSRQATPRLREIHDYLRELFEQLNAMDLEVQADFSIPGWGEVHGLNQHDYQVTANDPAQPTQIDIVLKCSADRRYLRAVGSRTVSREVQGTLRSLGIDSVSREQTNEHGQVVGEVLEMTPVIQAGIRIESDAPQRVIRLAISNFDTVGTFHLRFPLERLDETFLDDLGNYILRRHSNLTRLQMPEELRARLRERMNAEKSAERSKGEALRKRILRFLR